jgi:hypothetical protein
MIDTDDAEGDAVQCVGSARAGQDVAAVDVAAPTVRPSATARRASAKL